MVRGQGGHWSEVTVICSLGTAFPVRATVVLCDVLTFFCVSKTSQVTCIRRPCFLRLHLHPIPPSRAFPLPLTPRSLPHPHCTRRQQVTTTELLSSSCSYSTSHHKRLDQCLRANVITRIQCALLRASSRRSVETSVAHHICGHRSIDP